MSLRDFIAKQYIDVIQWTEEENGILATRYPTQDMEIQSGARLTVRESQRAAFINEGRLADVFGPGLYTLTTQNLPILTDLLHRNKKFQSPFKSDVYFFSARLQTAQKWGTATPITIRDKDFGAVRVRGYGIYAWHVFDPKVRLSVFRARTARQPERNSALLVANPSPEPRNSVRNAALASSR